MPSGEQDFYRIQKLPPYVFAVINEMKARARHDGMDVVDLGDGKSRWGDSPPYREQAN